MVDISNIAVFVGLDVGKSEHHAVAVDPAGKKLASTRLPQDETGLSDFIAGLQRRGSVIVVVDQPASIGLAGSRSAELWCSRGVFAGAGDASDRGPAPGRSQDRCPGCGSDR